MPTEPLRDADARERALDVSESFIVQAPAGSGKTGLLTRRFLRLLAIVDRPEEILAITFTRKAAAEMRMRIVRALQRAREGAVAEDAYEAAVLVDARLALARDDEMGWGLVSAPSRLQIMTLDALNGRLVGAMPVTAGAARVRIVEAELQDRLYAEAAASLLDWVTVDDARGAAARRFLTHLDASGHAWHRHIVAMLRRRDQWLGVLLGARGDMGALRSASESALRALVSDAIARVDAQMPLEHRERLLQLLRNADARLAEAGKSVASPMPARWPEADADAVGFWRRLASALLTQKGTWRKSVTVNDGFPPKPDTVKAEKEAFLALIADMGNDALAEALDAAGKLPDPHYADAQWETVEALLELLPVAAAELERIMAERGIADYTALAANAIDALGDVAAGRVTDLALRLDYRIRHVLVDEMQDTAPSQYRLLEGLTAGWEAGDGRTVFCVGDPMQSIYRFRGADVSLFLEAWERGIGNLRPERLLLSTNFRSEAGIIDWVNTHFEAILGDSNDPLTDAVAYRRAATAPGAPTGGGVHWHAGVDDAMPDAADIVATVAELRRNHPGETIGILARTRGALEPVLAGLRRAGIGCEALDVDRLTDLPEIIDLVNLTRALDHAGDRLSWLGLLRSPLLGWTLEDIDVFTQRADALTESAPVPELLARAECTAHLDARGAGLLAGFLDAYAASLQSAPVRSLRDRVERLWCELGGPAALPDAEAAEHVWMFLDALSRLERDGQLDSLPDLVPALDALRVTRHADRPDVSGMTIYRSKGLEFDHVVIPALQAGTRRNEKPPILFDVHAQAGSEAVLFSTLSSRVDAEGDPLHDLLWQREQVRSRNELDRLLYVAATRARRTLHLFAGARRNKDGQIGAISPDTLLGRFGAIGLRALEAAPDARGDGRNASPEAYETEWLPATDRRITSPWQSPALPERMGDPRFGSAPTTEAVEFDWAGSGARHVGTVVHAWLHRLAGCDDPAATLASTGDVEARSRALLADLGVAPADLDANVRRVVDALRGATEGTDAGWLIGGSGPEDRAEFALGALVDGRAARLVIDRVVRDASGTLWLVDYKASRHEGGDLEGFFANECRRYRGQLERYAVALRDWYRDADAELGALRLGLYFTLYGRLVPLDGAG